MVKRMDVQSRLLLGGVAGVAGAVWGWLLGFDLLVVIAIAIGAALPAWMLSRLSVSNVQTTHDGLQRALDEFAVPPPSTDALDDGDRLADVYLLVPRHARPASAVTAQDATAQDATGQERMRPTPLRPQRQRDTG